MAKVLGPYFELFVLGMFILRKVIIFSQPGTIPFLIFPFILMSKLLLIMWYKEHVLESDRARSKFGSATVSEWLWANYLTSRWSQFCHLWNGEPWFKPHTFLMLCSSLAPFLISIIFESRSWWIFSGFLIVSVYMSHVFNCIMSSHNSGAIFYSSLPPTKALNRILTIGLPWWSSG